MDLVPLDTREPMEDNSYLSERAIFARSREIERRLNSKKKETLLDKFRAVAELIGGVPRLAVEADEQPWEFYKLQARLESAEKARHMEHTLRILAPAIPPTDLDGPIDVEFEEVPPTHDPSSQKDG